MYSGSVRVKASESSSSSSSGKSVCDMPGKSYNDLRHNTRFKNC